MATERDVQSVTTHAINRRSFLKLAGFAAAAGILVPAWTPPRAPYVAQGQEVDYIGRAGGGFTGGTLVHSIGDWDQIGYPVIVRDQGYPSRPVQRPIYDFDLCLFRDEVPSDFWHHQRNRDLYPNVHTYVRTKRFGETIAQAIESLNFTTAGRV
jgi:hypothetical protein